MLTNSGHLTYCTNIHTGESWHDHFDEIKKHFPSIRNALTGGPQMGIGLRLSNVAATELAEEKKLDEFKHWLLENDAYVFTMNGFPYGSFHGTRVKDLVHAPDWTTAERVEYTGKLFKILKELLPSEMEGGVSTSPLSYRHWFSTGEALNTARKIATDNILTIAEQLIETYRATGKVLHLDIEPEPDGILETGREFIDWFLDDLLKDGGEKIAAKFNVSIPQAEQLLKEHIRLCYDVCHFAVGYEGHDDVLVDLEKAGIKVGKIQISAALKAPMNDENSKMLSIKESFEKFNEPTYLHQVVAKKNNGQLIRYPDLPEALSDFDNKEVNEWRAHFHVPIFEEDFGALRSTQADIREVLHLQKMKNFTQHLEVETYTWEVLPASLKRSLEESITRELQWVIKNL